jgi:phosphoribosyl 1,2-cyclic phosphate phosphodiesterase
MKLTYLGTSAAEGFPAVFCNCKYCNEARRAGGRNIRTRSQALINDDLLIDLPADTYHHFLTNGIRGDRIGYLIVTHGHSDHFYPNELHMRGGCYSHDMERQTLHILASDRVYRTCEGVIGSYEKSVRETYALHEGVPFETVTLGDYRITPLPARHAPAEKAMMYLIEEGDKALLYAHDTGFFFEEVFAFLKDRGIRLRAVSFDCTNVNIPIADTGSHMGFPNIARVIDRLTEIGAIDEGTKKIVNHFSHNGNPMQDYLEACASPLGCAVSYDGLTVEI